MRSPLRLAMAVTLVLGLCTAMVGLPSSVSTVSAATAAAPAVSPSTVSKVVVADSMTRVVADGWGAADVGGTYQVTHPGHFSVDNGSGVMELTGSAASETATLPTVLVRDVIAQFRVAVASLPTAGWGTYISAIIREQAGFGYRVLLRLAPLGAAYLSMSRINGSPGALTPVGPTIRLPETVAPGSFVTVAVSATGDTSVELAARAWISGAADPGWQIRATDASAARVWTPGAFALSGYSSRGSGAAELSFGDITVTSFAPASTTAPSTTAPSTTAANTTAPSATTAASTTASTTPSTSTVPSTSTLPTTARSTTATSMTSATSTTTATTTPTLPTTTLATTPTTATVSSAANASGAQALTDGTVSAGQTGAEWFAATGDSSPWAQLSFSKVRQIASAQIFGPTADWVDPAAPAAAAMWGMLTFSDGSSVIVSGIAGGGGAATTVAFAPRSVSWVRLQLMKTDPQAQFGLREFAVYDIGTTPPRWPANTAPRYAVPPLVAGQCTTSSTPVGSSIDGSPALVCPQPGSSISGPTTIVVSAPPGTALTASAWLPTGSAGAGAVNTVATAVANGAGRATFTVDAAQLTTGPTGIRFTTSVATDRPLYLQLNNTGGHALIQGDTAPTGMTLQWNDDFSSPVSLTQSGAGADYAATKPAPWGGSSFGDAIFADPAQGLNTIATVDGNFLRIRTQSTGSTPDPQGWGRTHVSGLMSSLKVGASGFSAQDGYFEARMLGPASYGTWPAFWLLNTENAANRETPASEIDVTELYGQFPQGSCHSLHAWNTTGNNQSACFANNGASDWALSWHTYAGWVHSDRVDYYIDGHLVASIPGPILTNEPFYFMLDESLGGGWPENLAGTGELADLYVDWVRVYT